MTRPAHHHRLSVPTLARLAMRTRFEIALPGADDPARLRAAGEEALDEIDRAETLLSAYRDDAGLFRVNALAARQPVAVAAPLLAVLTRAMELCAATDGAFDLATGALLACWDLPGMAGGSGRIPDDQAIDAARDACGMRRHLLIDASAGTVRFGHPGLRLDPGAIGKGYALDRAAEVLREHGVAEALLHGGTSTVCAIGRPPGQPAWTIAIRHPLRVDAHCATAALDGGSLSVSAVHGRSFTVAGRRFGHVIDPRSGWPVQDSLLAAVIHPSALVSDALSTALLVLGEAGLPLLRARFPEADLLLAREGDDPDRLRLAHLGSGFAIAA